jgi:heme-degrading monooxygenase HmoA
MHARMFVVQAPPEQLEEGIRVLRDRGEEIRALPGFRHGHLLVDRRGGELVALTLWESEQAMTDAQPAARAIMGGAVQAMGGQVPQPRQYEVAFDL